MILFEYFKGFILVFFQIITFYLLGKSIKKDSSFSIDFLIGYLLYSFFVAIGGIACQVLNTPWNVFSGYMCMLWIIMFFIIIKALKKEDKLSFLSIKEIVISFFKENWVLILICGLLVLCSLFNYIAFWFNNHLDDGYYIPKMMSFAFENPFSINVSTGLHDANRFTTYIFNTAEIESGFYIDLFNISPTLYSRVFLSAFNYFLLANLIIAIFNKISNDLNLVFKKYQTHLISAIMFIFSSNQLFLEKTGLLYVQDSNQFTTAMYYGSSIVRAMGLFLLIFLYIDAKSLKIKDYLIVAGIGFILVSKSSIAVPLIYLVCISFLVVYLISSKDKLKIFSGFFLLFLIFLISKYIGFNEVVQVRINQIIRLTSDSSILIICSFFVIILSTFFKSKVINRLNLFFTIMLLLMTISPFNYVFNRLCVYNFVAGRIFACYFYSLIMIAFMYLIILIKKINNKIINVKFTTCFCAIVFCIGNLFSYSKCGGDLFVYNQPASLITSAVIMLRNPRIIPDSTIELGKVLEKLNRESNDDVYAVMEELSVVNYTYHPLATIIRTYAPNIKSISAIGRYGVSEGDFFENYANDESQIKFQAFVDNPNVETFNEFKQVLDTYSINCIVVPNKECNTFLTSDEYSLFDTVFDESADVEYYIFARKDMFN